MKKILALGLVVFSYNCFADEIVQKLESENKLLKQRIRFNEQVIQERSLSTFNIKGKKSVVSKKKDNQLEIGLDSINWGEEFKANIPRVGYAKNFDRIRVSASYARGQFDNWPTRGSQTIINIYKADAGYAFDINDDFKLIPRIGITRIEVSSPDAGIAADSSIYANELAQYEKGEVDFLESLGGVKAGLTASYALSKSWDVIANADFSLSTNVNFGYKF